MRSCILIFFFLLLAPPQDTFNETRYVLARYTLQLSAKHSINRKQDTRRRGPADNPGAMHVLSKLRAIREIKRVRTRSRFFLKIIYCDRSALTHEEIVDLRRRRFTELEREGKVDKLSLVTVSH